MTFLSASKNTFFLWVLLIAACGSPVGKKSNSQQTALINDPQKKSSAIVVAANRTEEYLPLLRGKKLGVVSNHTSVIFASNPENADGATHLVDSLLLSGVEIEKVFAPEHGFRGRADAGETVKDGLDNKTGLAVISLYGANKKPTSELLKNIELVLFDIQDVGVRFYTYIATLQLVMEACAELDIPVIVLDRPNPNIHYVDGPTMENEHKGFLGLTPIPLVYGLTIGEYALMINGESWLENGLKADLTVIPLHKYNRNSSYKLPIRPSPNLPNAKSVNLYPSLGLFEGTNINAGRGTEFQFQRFGAPFLDSDRFNFSYIPQPNFGAKNPKHKGQICYGKDLSTAEIQNQVRLKWLIEAYENCIDKSKFFNTSNFTRHAGTEVLQQQIENGLSEKVIRESWKERLESYEKIRAKYIIYD